MDNVTLEQIMALLQPHLDNIKDRIAQSERNLGEKINNMIEPHSRRLDKVEETLSKHSEKIPSIEEKIGRIYWIATILGGIITLVFNVIVKLWSGK